MTKAEYKKTSQEIENILEVLYNLLCKLIVFTLKSFIVGIKFLWQKRSKTILILSIAIVVITVFLHFIYNKMYVSVCPVLIYIFTTGTIKNFSLLTNKSKTKLFEKINFKDKNGNFPLILKVIKASKGRQIIICKSYIPYSYWVRSKENLETAFNSRLAIKKQNNNTIKLIKLGR